MARTEGTLHAYRSIICLKWSLAANHVLIPSAPSNIRLVSSIPASSRAMRFTPEIRDRQAIKGSPDVANASSWRAISSTETQTLEIRYRLGSGASGSGACEPVGICYPPARKSKTETGWHGATCVPSTRRLVKSIPDPVRRPSSLTEAVLTAREIASTGGCGRTINPRAIESESPRVQAGLGLMV